jgi:hypothetical protein
MQTRNCVPASPSMEGEQCQSVDTAVKNSNLTKAIAAMDCSNVDLVQRAVLTAVAESIEKGATIDLGDGNFQKVPGSEDAAIAHHRAELHRRLLDQLVKAHQAGDAAEVEMLLDRLTVAHMAVTFEELIDYRASQAATAVEDEKCSAG